MTGEHRQFNQTILDMHVLVAMTEAYLKYLRLIRDRSDLCTIISDFCMPPLAFQRLQNPPQKLRRSCDWTSKWVGHGTADPTRP